VKTQNVPQADGRGLAVISNVLIDLGGANLKALLQWYQLWQLRYYLRVKT